MADHIAALRKVDCFANASILYVPEANLGDYAQDTADMVLRRFDGVSVLCDRDNDYGVRTNPGMPQMYARTFAPLLTKDAVSYHKHLVVANQLVKNVTQAEKVAKIKGEFERQLRAFRRIPLLPKSVLALARYAYTGKADKDNNRSASMRDDLVMSLLMGIYYSDQYANNYLTVRGFDERLATGHQQRLHSLDPYVETRARRKRTSSGTTGGKSKRQRFSRLEKFGRKRSSIEQISVK